MNGKLLIVATVLMDVWPTTKIHVQLTTRDVIIVNAQDILRNIVKQRYKENNSRRQNKINHNNMMQSI